MCFNGSTRCYLPKHREQERRKIGGEPLLTNSLGRKEFTLEMSLS